MVKEIIAINGIALEDIPKGAMVTTNTRTGNVSLKKMSEVKNDR